MLNWISGLSDTVIAALVVALVTLLLHFLNSSSKSKERLEEQKDEEVRKIEYLTLEIRELACDYWSMPENHSNVFATGYSIAGRLFFLGRLFEDLFSGYDSENNEIIKIYRMYYKSCTGENFMVKNRKSQIEKREEIEKNAYLLIHTCYKLRKKLPSNRWQVVKYSFFKFCRFFRIREFK